MKIRTEQTEVFRQIAMADFERRAVKHLRTQLAKQTASSTDDDLLARVRECIPRAGAYGLASEKEVMSFVDASYLLECDFDSGDRYPEIEQTLADALLNPADKAGRLLGLAWRIHQSQHEEVAGSQEEEESNEQAAEEIGESTGP